MTKLRLPMTAAAARHGASNRTAPDTDAHKRGPHGASPIDLERARPGIARSGPIERPSFLPIKLLAAIIAAVSTGFMAMPTRAQSAQATLAPTSASGGKNVAGSLSLEQVKDKVLVTGSVSGLNPGQEHGFHIHAVPDCSGDGMKTAGHFNPDNHPHAHPGERARHAGAMVNLKADASGVASFRQEVDTITLTPGKYSVIGMPMIVHAGPDDYKSQPLGAAGPRIACGLIQAAR